MRRLDDGERAKVESAFERYLQTIPNTKRFRGIAYDIKDVVGKTGLGIGSAGLPSVHRADRGLQPGARQRRRAVDEAGQRRRAESRPHRRRVHDYFMHHGHRTAVSQRALQAHADPLLGYTDIDGSGFVVSEFSPYEADLDWSELTEPDELGEVVEQLGRAVAKVHCVGDTDSDQSLVDFQTEEAIDAVIGDHLDEFVDDLVKFGLEYGATVRDDHRHFVEAFREGRIPGISCPDGAVSAAERSEVVLRHGSRPPPTASPTWSTTPTAPSRAIRLSRMLTPS